MRYLQLMYTYAPAWGFGGPSRMMFDYARWMSGSARSGEVIAGDVHHDYTAIKVRSEVLEGIRIRRVRVFFRRLVKSSLNCVSPDMLLRAAAVVRSESTITVIHIAELRSPVFFYAAVLKRLWPSRVALLHSAFGMLHHRPSLLRRVFDPLLMGFLIRSVDVGLVQNSHEANEYAAYRQRYGADKLRVVLLPLHTPGPPAPMATLLRRGDEYRRTLRSRLGVSADEFVFVFLGRINAGKGIVRAIDAALAFSLKSGRKVRFFVVGRDDGFQSEVLGHIERRGASQKVTVVNNVYEGRFEYYAVADVFLGFPLIYEETMLASVEALSCGTPVILSREADIPFVEDTGAGYVIDYSEGEAVARIERIADDPATYRRRALEVSADCFSEDASSSRFKAVVEDAAARVERA